jgi:hypothetical protein
MRNTKSGQLTQLVAACLAIAVLLSSSPLAFAGAGSQPLAGEIIVSGNKTGDQPLVTLNGENALSGRTFQTAGTVATSETGSATINMGKLGRVSLSPNSSLSLVLAENSISGELTAGKMQVFNKDGVTVSIKTPDNQVTNDAAKADFTVDLTSGTTVASATSGNAFFNSNGTKVAAKKQNDDDDDDDFNAWVPIIVFAAIAGGVAAWVLLRDDDDVASPTR